MTKFAFIVDCSPLMLRSSASVSETKAAPQKFLNFFQQSVAMIQEFVKTRKNFVINSKSDKYLLFKTDSPCHISTLNHPFAYF